MYKTIDGTTIGIGDWIRFYRGGSLVIGVVEYVQADAVLNKISLLTNIGTIHADSVVEFRKPPV